MSNTSIIVWYTAIWFTDIISIFSLSLCMLTHWTILSPCITLILTCCFALFEGYLFHGNTYSFTFFYSNIVYRLEAGKISKQYWVLEYQDHQHKATRLKRLSLSKAEKRGCYAVLVCVKIERETRERQILKILRVLQQGCCRLKRPSKLMNFL